MTGGYNGESVADLDIYDPSASTWSPGGRLNIRRESHGLAVCQGRLYAISGLSEDDLTDTVETYVPASRRLGQMYGSWSLTDGGAGLLAMLEGDEGDQLCLR